MYPINNTTLASPMVYSEESARAEQLNAWLEWATESQREAGECRDMVVTRLEDCLARGDTELFLSDLGLTSLPPQLPDWLEMLNIANNRLIRVPDVLPACLKVLQAGFNELTCLPATLPNGLERLYVTNNRLSCLPERLPDSLKVLGVEKNRLTCLPEFLPVSLEDLGVAYNQLTCLSKPLPDSLKILRAGYNPLTHLPEALPASLRTLHASHSQLTDLPLTLPNALKGLHVTGNQLTQLPAHLPAGLSSLNFTNNQLTDLPMTLPDGLKELDVSNNQLTQLPAKLPEGLLVLRASRNQLINLPLTLPNSLEELTVYSNHLVDLPTALPASLRRVNVSRNQLTCLPEALPYSLETLDIHHNLLAVFPECLPANLTSLDIGHNQLTSLPPLSSFFLKRLNVSHNQLTALPENLPALRELYVHNNQLTSLPATLPHSLNTLYIANNLLPEFPENLPRNLFQIDIDISVHQLGLSYFLRTLKRWDDNISVAHWTRIYSEKYARVFVHFLKKLNKGKNPQNNDLRHRLADWLMYLARDNHQELRRQTFLLANEAVESCVDRASFYFNHMYILMIEHQLLASEAPLPQVVEAIRGTFRLQVLEGIAAEKVAARRQTEPDFAEDLEIYLAYQCQLRESLALPVYTELQFEGIAAITDEDISQARQRIIEAEETAFGRYWLTESALWTAKLEKWDPEKKAAADNAYLEAIASAQFHEKVNKALQEKGIAIDDIDAHRDLSKTMATDLLYQYRYQLTRQFLLGEQALSLLDQCIAPALPQG